MKGDINTALALFKMNVEMYPYSSNVYDSYGEALLKNGQQDLAIENYKKSVELNPANKGGIQALEKMGVKVEKVEVSEATLDSYVGIYKMGKRNIVVTKEGKQLFASTTQEGKYELYPRNAKEFFFNYTKQYIFNINNHGAVKSITLCINDHMYNGKKIK